MWRISSKYQTLGATRWFVRAPAIDAALNQYGLILQTLRKVQLICSKEVSVRASGLPSKFQCLVIAQHVMEPLERLNKSLQ